MEELGFIGKGKQETEYNLWVNAEKEHLRRMAGDVARQVEINSELLGEQTQVFLVLAVTGSNVHVEPLARIAGAGDDRQQEIVHGRRGRLQALDQLPDCGTACRNGNSPQRFAGHPGAAVKIYIMHRGN